MNRTIAPRAIFLAAMVFTSSAFAGSTDVKKCVTASGHVTLTDEACPDGTQAVKVISSPSSDADQAVKSDVRTIVTERFAAARMPARYVTLMKSATPARGLSLDVTTLRAARANLQMYDNATQSLRQQRVAGLQ